MKGDFTRLTYRREKHYSSVLQQQGRVQLDADWNEQAEICSRRDTALAADLIGPCGAPSRGGGFAVSCAEDADLRLSAGRLYVGGTLCELDAETSYIDQPDLPGAAAVSPARGRTDLIYLDVWERLITAVDDPDIRDPALGGSDTATRAKTVWQARILPDVEVSRCEESIDGWPPPAGDARLAIKIRGQGAEHAPGEEELVPPAGGFPFLENSLYRVEIHDGGSIGAATFKWSRDNGSLVFAVRELLAAPAGAGTRVSVERVGPDPSLALRQGDWVEALGDRSELLLTPGKMARVDEVDEAQRIVTLDRDVSSQADESHPKLRRWDGAGTLAVTEGVAELEDGIEVQFSGDSFVAGDYWIFPVRETGPALGWGPVPPCGIRHDYCKLALVRWGKGRGRGWTCDVTDCRPLFGSLTRGQTGGCGECRREIAELRTRLEEQAGELRRLHTRLA